MTTAQGRRGECKGVVEVEAKITRVHSREQDSITCKWIVMLQCPQKYDYTGQRWNKRLRGVRETNNLRVKEELKTN